MEFRWPLRVYIEDTDAGGIVYYVNYLRFMERARTELIRHLGFERLALIDQGVMYVVHSTAIRYLQSAVLDDQLAVTAEPVRVGRSFIGFEQQILRQPCGTLLAEAEVKIACVDVATRRPSPLPQNLRQALISYRNGQEKPGGR